MSTNPNIAHKKPNYLMLDLHQDTDKLNWRRITGKGDSKKSFDWTKKTEAHKW